MCTEVFWYCESCGEWLLHSYEDCGDEDCGGTNEWREEYVTCEDCGGTNEWKEGLVCPDCQDG